MEAKLKAKELVERFEGLKHPAYDGWGTEHDFSEELAKQCALICVDEIIAANPSISFFDSSNGTELRINVYYYQDVKKEIELL